MFNIWDVILKERADLSEGLKADFRRYDEKLRFVIAALRNNEINGVKYLEESRKLDEEFKILLERQEAEEKGYGSLQ